MMQVLKVKTSSVALIPMPYGPIVLAAVLIEYVLVMLADVLNLRALRSELPAAFARVYAPARYERSQAYTRALTRFGWLPRTLDLTLLLALWFSGGFEWLDRVVRSLGFGPIFTGILYIGALVLAQEVVSLPFRWYSTFVIEERFGFNTTTRRTFCLDLLKGVLLTVVLGGPLLAAVLWLFDRAGDSAWIWCFGVTSAFLVAVQYVGPTWILPLFNEFRPIDSSEIKEAVIAYAQRADFPLEGIFVIDGSKRSTKANAFLTGFGRRKRIALFDTLIQQQSVEEIVAIVAHEIGHFKKGHVLKGLALGIAQLAVLFFLLGLFVREPRVFSAFHVSRPSTYVGLVLFAIAYAPIGLVVSMLVQAWERRHEFEADAFARTTTGHGEVLVRALEKLSAESLTNLTPHPFYVTLHHSHPPLAERVAALKA
jgi:STE24 endopeptidase